MDPQTGTSGEGIQPQDTDVVQRPQDPKAGEGESPQDPAKGEGKETPANIHKLEADIRRREKTIEELKAKLAERDEAGKISEERIAELERKFAESEQARAEAALTAKLTSAGCIDCKAAALYVDDYDSVDALKDAKPYLFRREGGASVKTGGQPATGASMTRKQIAEIKDASARRAAIAANPSLYPELNQ